MKTLTFETLADSNISTQLENDKKSKIYIKDFEYLSKFFNRYSVDFAIIDLGYMSNRQFNKTYLSKVLKESEIPYFTIELPNYVKENIVIQIDELKNIYYEIKATYDVLTDRTNPTARELKLLMNYYLNEIRELKAYINQKIKTDLIVKKIVNIIKGRNAKCNLVHFGKKSTFKALNSRLEEKNIESKILTVEL